MTLLERAYSEIGHPEIHDRPTRLTFELVEQILREQGEGGIADWVLDSSPSNLPWEAVAQILGIMIWSTSDNGSAIMRDAERWLSEAGDERRAFVAMNLDVYPFLDGGTMETTLQRVAAKFPRLKSLCSSLSISRNQLAEHAAAPNRSSTPISKSEISVRGSEG